MVELADELYFASPVPTGNTRGSKMMLDSGIPYFLVNKS